MNGKIVIAGGTGALGSMITARYLNSETEVVVLSRNARLGHDNVRYVVWDATTLGRWAKELEGATAVINLVGKSVNCRYTAKNKAEIIRSRVDATAVIGQAIQRATVPPKVWINAGSAAIFGNSGSEMKVEVPYWAKVFLRRYANNGKQRFINTTHQIPGKSFYGLGS